MIMSVCVKVLIEWSGKVDDANEVLLGSNWKDNYLEKDEIHSYANKRNILGKIVNIQEVFVYDFSTGILGYEHPECDMSELSFKFDRILKDTRCLSMQYWGNTTKGIVKIK
jgi:hypothetical protein